jgi:uncharacterized membrane protein YccF (DUF307 family)
MQIIGNIFWFFLGGFEMAIVWCVIGCIAFATIIGIPWGRACFTMAKFSLFPFGKEAVSREKLSQQKDLGTGDFGKIGNIIWFVLAGFFLALGHSLAALFCFITIIGIPFGMQHVKLAKIAIAPIGKVLVTKEEARSL